MTRHTRAPRLGAYVRLLVSRGSLGVGLDKL